MKCFHKLLVFFVIFSAFSSIAHADTLSISPTTLTSFDTPITISGDNASLSAYFFYPDGTYISSWEVDGSTINFQDNFLVTGPSGIYHALLVDATIEVTCSSPGINAYSDCLLDIGFMGIDIPLFIALTPVDPAIVSFTLISTTTAQEMIAGVGTNVVDTGSNLWVIVALSVSVGLTFYVINRVMGLLPVKREIR